jgi:hypothetical protein
VTTKNLRKVVDELRLTISRGLRENTKLTEEISKLSASLDASVRELNVVKTKLAITQMRIAATEPENDFWQAKAENLIREYLKTGKITEENIKEVPGDSLNPTGFFSRHT